jgi:hypothetical protein
MSRYDWSKAPDWARYAATDDGGASYWFEVEPKARESIGEWVSCRGYCESINTDWRKSLEPRPKPEEWLAEQRVNIGAKP